MEYNDSSQDNAWALLGELPVARQNLAAMRQQYESRVSTSSSARPSLQLWMGNGTFLFSLALGCFIEGFAVTILVARYSYQRAELSLSLFLIALILMLAAIVQARSHSRQRALRERLDAELKIARQIEDLLKGTETRLEGLLLQKKASKNAR